MNPLYAFLEIVHSTIVTMKTNRYCGLRNHLSVAVVFLVQERQKLRGFSVSLSRTFFCAILTWIRNIALGKIHLLEKLYM